MKRVLLAGLKQETASFNPVVTRGSDFHVARGPDLVETLASTRTELAGALSALAEVGIQVEPLVAAWCESGGPVDQADLDALIDELVEAVSGRAAAADGLYLALHGAMAGTVDGDPEGRLLEQVRHCLGDRPVVASLDLHAVLTDRMVRAASALVPFHTYPHVDQLETGRRAAGLLGRLLDGRVEPVAARVALPLLVRGDELITATGRFGEAIRRCRRIEASAGGLAAGVLIGNPFTDVPGLGSSVLVIRDGEAERAREEAEGIARFMWEQRHHFQARLVPLGQALAMAAAGEGLTVLSDAADATSSGAPGDSNAILRGLLDAGFSRRALLPIVDAPAAARAHAAGVGSVLDLALGGTLDPHRHPPLPVSARVLHLAGGDFAYADGTPARAGPTAVLAIRAPRAGSAAGNGRPAAAGPTVVVTSRPVHVMDRQVFAAHRQQPADYDLVVVKSPNGFRPHYESIAARIIPVDVPGATSANLRTLPYRHCVRPIFPLDPDQEIALPFAAEGTSEAEHAQARQG